MRRISLARSSTLFGDAGQAGHLDAVALVRAALDDFAQENDLIVPLAHGDVVISHPRQPRREFGQFMVMRGEKRFGADLVVQMFDDGPCQAQAVECARAAADFIQDDQAARGGVVEDVRRLAHFHHERRLAAGEVVAGADAGEDAVDQIDSRLRRRE